MKLYRLENNGIKVDICPIGASIVNFLVKDKYGKEVNIVLGYDNEEQYMKNETYFGSVVGPIANRVKLAKFTLDDITYKLTRNDGPNSLHGGHAELNIKRWNVIECSSTNILLSAQVKEGEGGYPCDIIISVSYCLTNDGELQIRYTAYPTARCPISITQHSYFNLDESKTILNHTLCMDSEHYLPVDENLIPVGALNVAHTPFDFRKPTRIGDVINKPHRQLEITGGFDHCWALNKSNTDYWSIAVHSKNSGISLRVKTDLPGVQFYSGNFLNKERGRRGYVYDKFAGLCLETQHFPNLVNTDQAELCIYDSERPFNSTTVYKVSVDKY